MSRSKAFSPRRAAIVLGALAIGLLAQQWGIDRQDLGLAERETTGLSETGVAERSDERIEKAFRDRTSGFMITVDGRVLKTLPDDNEGSRHQRFLVELNSGRTLLVAHNIDLADRAPVARGDAVRVRGQYEWNERGGVLHWTHHDPRGRHEGGWIMAGSERVE